MKSGKQILSWFVVLLLFYSSMNAQQTSFSSGTATVPRLVNFSGKATDAQGKIISGITGATFAIYTDQYEGTSLWLETQNIQADTKGNFTVQLGATKPAGLPLDVFSSGEAHWLGVTINGGQEQPRVLLLSVPYALKAADAETVGGLPASAFLRAPPANPSASPAAPTVSSAKTGPNVPPPASNVTTSGGTVNALPLWTTSTNIQSSALSQSGSGTSAKVGIATTTPAATLDVNGKGDVRDTLTLFPKGSDPTLAINGTTFKVDQTGKVTFTSSQTFPGAGTVTSVGLSAPSTDFTVSGSPITKSGTLALNWNVAPTSGNTANAIVKRDAAGGFSTQYISINSASSLPLYSISTCVSCVGLAGYSVATSGGGTGVYGETNSTQTAGSTGVYGYASSTSGVQFGTQGLSASSTGVGVGGVVGSYSSTANSIFGTLPIGVIGDSSGYGVVASSGSSTGLLAINNSGADTAVIINRGTGVPLYAAGPGGYVIADGNGNLSVSGAIFAGSKDFKIDHPLDPANKYLYHTSVESSEMMNIYTGNITTDSQGMATVRMPEWFEAVNTDFRYLLTVIGQFAQAIVSSKIENNQFTIRTGAPGVEVSWQVSSVRHDAYAKAHPLQVSVDKADNERGYYIHPELYGAVPEKGLASAHRTQVMQRAKQAQAMPAITPTPQR